MYRERREREEALNELKKQAEEKKAHAEKVERRLQRASIQHDELTPEQKQHISGEDQEKKISSFEEAFLAIKEATGVSDLIVRKVVDHIKTMHLQQPLLIHCRMPCDNLPWPNCPCFYPHCFYQSLPVG